MLNSKKSSKRGKRARLKMENELRERVKELNCLYGISELVEQPGIDIGGILDGVVSLLPPAWLYPEVTCARITYGEQVFETDNFKETSWKLSADIKVGGERVGAVEVYYLEEKPERDEGPFLREERDLINGIAERLGRIVERKQAEVKLKEYSENLEKMVEERTEAIRRLATPLVEVWDSVVMLPLVGILDTDRAKQITESVLEHIAEAKIEVTVLDISGIAAVDTKVADHIIRTVQAVKLMGSDIIITGIRPDVATTLVTLGVDLSGIETRSTLREGLEYAFVKTGWKVTRTSTT